MHWEKCKNDFFPYRGYGTDDYFEHTFLSYEMHLVKPSAEIFAEVLRLSGIKAEETLFVDDTKENCVAAEQQSISTLLETSGHDWLAILK